MLRGFLRRSEEERSRLTTILGDREIREDNLHRSLRRAREDLKELRETERAMKSPLSTVENNIARLEDVVVQQNDRGDHRSKQLQSFNRKGLRLAMKRRLNFPSNFGAPMAPTAWIPPRAAPPIAALWHHAKRLLASTKPIDACQDAAAVPAPGPNASNLTAPSTGTTETETMTRTRPVIRIATRYGCALT